jgi:hypothetical protein
MKQLTPIELLIIDLHILKLKGRNPAIEEVISIAENYLVKDKNPAVEEGDRVIITTSLLGEKYKGMVGYITSRKLLNDKYSIRFENGLEMAFDKDEFINQRTDR